MSETTFFAQVTDGIVTDVRVVTQEFLDANPERYTGTWVQTFRDVEGKTYAGINFTYDPVADEFVAPYVEPVEETDEP